MVHVFEVQTVLNIPASRQSRGVSEFIIKQPYFEQQVSLNNNNNNNNNNNFILVSIPLASL